jgi:hypothetical protein
MNKKNGERIQIYMDKRALSILRTVKAGRTKTEGRRVTMTEIIEALIDLNLSAEAAAYSVQERER